MLATVQRVSSAEIVIEGEIFTSIGDGCLMFVCVEKDDVSQNINNMVNKLLNFRMLDGTKGITSSSLNDSGKEVAMSVKKGDKILYGKYSGTEFAFEGTEYLIMRESDILAIL